MPFLSGSVFVTNQELADACNAESDDMEMTFMSILCTRSFPHLRRGKDQIWINSNGLIANLALSRSALSQRSVVSLFVLITVFQEFVKCTNKDIEQIIKKEMSGDVKNAFYAIGNGCIDS